MLTAEGFPLPSFSLRPLPACARDVGGEGWGERWGGGVAAQGEGTRRGGGSQ